MMASDSIGTVSELWRYPVKSMLGERCDALRVDARGAEGDRLYAVRDHAGKLGSGKNTRRFRKMDGLLQCQAGYHGSVPNIRLPTGDVVAADSPDIDQMLSDALGQPVVLTRASKVSHFDVSPVHLLTSASMAWLGSVLPEAGISARRFRPNLVIEVPGNDPVEQGWLGKRLRVGDELELLIDAATERCGMVALAQSELPNAPPVLREITQQADLMFGVYAQVVVPGIVRVNDPVVPGKR